MKKDVQNNLEGFLKETLPMIDEFFDKKDLEVHKRPLLAARQIVDFFIVDIKGYTKDNYLFKPWFIKICHCVDDWYALRYGESAIHPPKNLLHGLTIHYSTLYKLNIPITLTKPAENDTTWIKFPIEVFPDENVLEWIEPRLQFEAITERRRISLVNTISTVATHLRVINNDLNTADYEDSKTRAMAESVLHHFEKAASDAINQDRKNSSLAPWELSTACEKTIKTYLSQENVTFPKIHDLRKLHKLADPNGSMTEEKKALSEMPSEQRIMDWRYGESSAPTQKEIMRFYSASLIFCRLYASRLKRKLVLKNASFKIRKPPKIRNAN
jgi:hypothetical protein